MAFCLFDESILLGGDLVNAYLSTSTLTDAYYDSQTRFPIGFDPQSKKMVIAAARDVIQRMYARGKRCFEQSDLLLSDANLSKLNLEGCSFCDIDLSNINLSHSNLTGASFRRTNLSFADISHGILKRAAFKDSDLRFAQLSKSDIRFSIFDRSNLSGCKFQDSELSPSIFVGFYYDENTIFPESFSELDKGMLVDDRFCLRKQSLLDSGALQKSASTSDGQSAPGNDLPMDTLSITSNSNVQKLNSAQQHLSDPQRQHHAFGMNGAIGTVSSQQRPLVLCVDDSPIVRTMLKRILVDHYEVHLACNGMEALSVLKKNDISLVLLDVTMPDVDGYEVCRTIRKIDRLKELPVVMITAKDSVFDRVRGKFAGTNRYLTKPLETDKVLSVVEEFTAKKAVA